MPPTPHQTRSTKLVCYSTVLPAMPFHTMRSGSSTEALTLMLQEFVVWGQHGALTPTRPFYSWGLHLTFYQLASHFEMVPYRAHLSVLQCHVAACSLLWPALWLHLCCQLSKYFHDLKNLRLSSSETAQGLHGIPSDKYVLVLKTPDISSKHRALASRALIGG